MKNILFYGTAWCGDCRLPKQYLDDHKIPYTYIDIDQDPEAAAEVERINIGYQSVPTIVLPNGKILVEPSVEELKSALAEDKDVRIYHKFPPPKKI